ncbi:DUF190 domain-containing protein [Ferviditalea candida]|uniref:DUF190 domain-containing protein n=1 Tax=Ferviditalea candida TaxID=3108399 RepID=A0ABU5ZFY6_9BACL|nr:DUF190 domain-containing protein [Paenibacillaceae bacterium T2]
MNQLLQIVVGELESGKSEWKTLYAEVVQVLWKHGFSGATVFRSDEGIGEKDDIRAFILEDVQFNNLPIVIETVERADRIHSVLPELRSIIPHGEMAIMNAYSLMEEELPVKHNEALMLKIYIKEKSSWFSRALYEEILDMFQKRDLIWTTVTKGIEGFGRDHVIHKQSLFSFSSQVPIVIESVGKAEVIQEIIPELRERVKEGMVIAVSVQVVIDR